MNLVDTIKSVGNVASAIVVITTCLGLICKPVRSRLVNWVRDTSKTDECNEKITKIDEKVDKLCEKVDALAETTHIINDKVTVQEESLKSLLRNGITRIYYKYLPEKQLPSYERKNIIEQTSSYDKLHGNTYVHDIVQQMLEWEVIDQRID